MSLAPAAFFAPCSACSRLLSALAGGPVGCGEPSGLVDVGFEPGELAVPVCVVWGVVDATWPTLPAPLAGIVSGGGVGATRGCDAGVVPGDVVGAALDWGALDVPVAELLVDGEFEAVVPGGAEVVCGSPGL